MISRESYPESRKVLLNGSTLRALFEKNGVWKTARLLKVGRSTVRRWLDFHGIKRGDVINVMALAAAYPRILQSRKDTTFVAGGYRFIRRPGKREQAEHRAMIEKSIGRELDRKEVVHHVDLDSLHNDLGNLVLCSSQSEHQKIHRSLNDLTSRLVKEGVIGFDHKAKQYFYNGEPECS